MFCKWMWCRKNTNLDKVYSRRLMRAWRKSRTRGDNGKYQQRVCKTKAISGRTSEEATETVMEAWRLECMVYLEWWCLKESKLLKSKKPKCQRRDVKLKTNPKKSSGKAKTVWSQEKECDENRRWSLIRCKTRRGWEELKMKAQTRRYYGAEDQNEVVSKEESDKPWIWPTFIHGL